MHTRNRTWQYKLLTVNLFVFPLDIIDNKLERIIFIHHDADDDDEYGIIQLIRLMVTDFINHLIRTRTLRLQILVIEFNGVGF